MLIDGKITDIETKPADQENDSAGLSVTAENSEDAPLASPSQKKKTPDSARRCIVSKECYAPRLMIRFVLSPDNIVTPDLDEKLPGRGAWVKADKATLQEAVKTNAFNKSFKAKAIIPDDMIERIGFMLNQRCLNLLNLARRTGECVVGFDKAIDAVKKADVAIYVTGANEGTDSRRKLENALRENATIISLWGADELSKNFGTDNTNHIVIKRSGIANKIVKEYRKLYAVIV